MTASGGPTQQAGRTGSSRATVGRMSGLSRPRGREVHRSGRRQRGVYALALPTHFKRVVTFEPTLQNACLDANAEARDGLRAVVAFHSALGERRACVPIAVEADNAGLTGSDTRTPGQSSSRFDNIKLNHCDAIWLDVEV